jgi:RNA polymerase-binding protein DksA
VAAGPQPTDVERFRELLLAHRESAEHAYRLVHDGNPVSLEDETEEESFDNHLADVATATYMRELDFTLEDNTEHVIAEIDAALKRIEEGTYGTCVRCRSTIAKERLEAMPYAMMCIECKRVDERG